MRLLVSRPEPEGMKLAGLLEERGHEATVEPLMRLSFEGCDPIDLEGAVALVATSGNALRALSASGMLVEARRLPLFVVGKGTAREARRLGFEQILVGPGTAVDLVPVISATLEPSAGLLVHLAGDRLAFDLKGELEQHGFRVVQPTVYRMLAADALSTSTIDQLNDGDIEGVILMSPRTAAIYARLVTQHRLTSTVRSLAHFCLSAGVASRLSSLGGVRVFVPERPALEDLLAEIELTAAQWGE
jgi:uroporphyrinogen-III synthase